MATINNYLGVKYVQLATTETKQIPDFKGGLSYEDREEVHFDDLRENQTYSNQHGDPKTYQSEGIIYIYIYIYIYILMQCTDVTILSIRF